MTINSNKVQPYLMRQRMVQLTLLLISLFIPLNAVRIDLNDYNEWNFLKLVAELIPKNPVIVQAGAHQGDAVIQIAAQWPKGEIYAFEPNPLFFSILKNKTSSYAYVNLFPFALNSHMQTAVFYLSENENNPRIGSLFKSLELWSWYYRDASRIIVNCINLQEWAQRQLKKPIDFLWLDIGGAELHVLESIPQLLQSLSVIFLETHFQKFREGSGTYIEVKNFLHKYNFEEIQHWHIPHFQGYALFAKQGCYEICK